MIHSTRGIVFQQIKYSETSLIVKIYTESHGLQGFILKGIRKTKKGMKPALFQNMSALNLQVYHKPNTSLHHIREASPCFYPATLYSEISKSSMLVFINEILVKSIREEEANLELFAFIYDSIEKLDGMASRFSGFHLHFMIHLAKYLGFFPLGNYSETNPHFDLAGGMFRKAKPDEAHILPEQESLWLNRLAMEPDILAIPGFPDKNTRNNLLDGLMAFYSIHIPAFGEMKSLKVLKAILQT
ncbi:MAG: DNA repair protein RecO [Bacteroidales bacterium]|nr:DNA repair protein RecO [Bacteroidales bacterium]